MRESYHAKSEQGEAVKRHAETKKENVTVSLSARWWTFLSIFVIVIQYDVKVIISEKVLFLHTLCIF